MKKKPSNMNYFWMGLVLGIALTLATVSEWLNTKTICEKEAPLIMCNK